MKLWRVLARQQQHPGAGSNFTLRAGNELKSLKARLSTYSLDSDRRTSSSQSSANQRRSTRLILVNLRKRLNENLGINLAESSDVGCPSISSLRPGSVAYESDQLATGDRVMSVNGVPTSRMRCQEVADLLNRVEDRALLEIEYSLPDFSSQNSLCLTTKITNITLEREDGSLGITLRGGANSDPLLCRPFVITHVRPHGPAHRSSRIKAGDRLVRVDGQSLANKTLLEAQEVLSDPSARLTTLTIEYDIGVVESVRFARGPLLVEVERRIDEDLGLILTELGPDTPGVFVENIIPASVADRCGALSIGDKILAVDDVYIENTVASPADVMRMLQNNTSRGYTQLQILPYHTVCRSQNNIYRNRSDYQISPSSSGFSTINSRRAKNRNSFVPHLFDMEKTPIGSYGNGQIGICHTDCLIVTLDAARTGYGLSVSTNGSTGNDEAHIVITHISMDSPAYRCGCLQVGDRILAVDHHRNLTLQEVQSILDMGNDASNSARVTLQVEFDVADTIVPTTGIFNVKLAKRGPGLGITITASRSHPNDPFVIADIRKGSIAHRTGSLTAGDRLLAVNGKPLDCTGLDSALSALHGDIVTLRVQKVELEPPAKEANDPTEATEEEEEDRGESVIYTVELLRGNGPIGITIAGSEDCMEPVVLSRLTEGGLAEKTGALHVGDRILAINGESLDHRPLSDAIRMLQSAGERVQLKISRKIQREIVVNGNTQEETRVNYSSPGLASNDSAVDSWDSITLENAAGNISGESSDQSQKEKPKDDEIIIAEQPQESLLMVRHKDRMQFYSDAEESLCPSPLPLPNFTFNNNNHNNNNCTSNNSTASQEMHIPFFLHNQQTSPPQQQIKFSSFRPPDKVDLMMLTSESGSDRDLFLDDFNNDTGQLSHEIYQVSLHKDSVYDDYGFSVSDGLYEKGVYINRIRKGGPADIGMLRPYDRILQVNDTKTRDFDCCLTVPIIASAGDSIDLVVSRSPYMQINDEKDLEVFSWITEEQDLIGLSPRKSLSNSQNTITKTL